MRKHRRSILILLVTAIAASAQEAKTSEPYTIIADLAIAVMLTPEAGDQIIANNSKLYDSRFYSAMDDRIRYFQALAANHYEYCNQARPEPRANQQCYQENEPAKNMHLLQTLRDATRNNPRWSQSLMAQASVMGKQAIGANTWSTLQRSFFAPIRPLFIVE